VQERAFNLKALLILSLGHLVTDVYQGALPAILPLLRDRLALSYSMAGVIILASNITSSVIQPIFGLYSDREEKPLLLPLGCMFAGLGFSLLTLAPGYGLVLACVMISGLGVAAYHPEGFKTASHFTGTRPATSMSIFSVGGNLGFALGPIVALSIVSHFGFGYLPLVGVFVPVFLVALLPLWKMLSRGGSARPVARDRTPPGRSAVTWPVVILVATVIVRSWIHAGLMTYVPFYYIDYLKGDPVHAGQLVSSFLLGGVAGTLLGSPIADKWGHKRYLVTSMLLASLLFPAILAVEGILLGVVLALFGMVLISTFTVTIVMAQRLMPHNLGMASGLMVGFAIGTGGLGVTILGLVADRWGVPFALQSICLLPIAGFILSALLKYPSAAPIVERASSS
jgi:FSR family fosmidomycin resistance protein-like MFS transporter